MQISQSEVNGVKVVAVEGEVDMNTSPGLRKVFDQLIKEGVKKVLIDLAGADYIDSSCLATLIEMQQRLKGIDGSIYISNISDKVKGIFEVTKVDKLFKIFDSQEEALDQI